jgi:hypothetical protein
VYLTVDLASKFSAAILRDGAGRVIWQGDSGKNSASEWVSRLGHLVRRMEEAAHPITHILVEDVPYGISNQAMVKPVLRLQGMLIHELGSSFYFINPSTWQKEYEGVSRAPKGMTKAEGAKYRIEKAAEHAKNLGYEAPDLVQQWIDENPDKKPLKKYTNPLDKARTDYCDAFLMNDWLQRHQDDYTTLSGVQPAFI